MWARYPCIQVREGLEAELEDVREGCPTLNMHHTAGLGLRWPSLQVVRGRTTRASSLATSHLASVCVLVNLRGGDNL